jgi:hypothetical protein
MRPRVVSTSEGAMSHEDRTNDRRKERGRVVSTHVFGLTVATLADASRAARTVDHAVTLVDETSHMVVVVDQRGRVMMRPQEHKPVG